METAAKKEYYKDFIGETISVSFSPAAICGQGLEWDILKRELRSRIKKELNYQNGLLCQFENIKCEIVGNKIVVSGTVTKCEVDC